MEESWSNCRNVANFVNFSVNPLQSSLAFSNSSFSSAYATVTSSQETRKEQAFTVSYLVDSLGLTTKLAESISKKVTFEEKRNPDSILNLLRAHEFTDSQISSIVTDYPRLLLLDAEKSVAPKLRFLQSRGALNSELTEIVSSVPEILGKDRSFVVYYDFVKEVIESDKSSSSSSSSSKLCHCLAQGSKQENKIRNLSVLRELGMPQKLLFPLLISDSPHVCGKEKFEESLKKVVEMGFDPRTSRFLDALRTVYTLKKETMEEKVNVYKRLGFEEGDVWEMFKKWPISLTHSEKKIKRKFETLRKCGLVEDEIRLICKKFPQVIGVSEEKIESSVETFLGIGLSRDEFALMLKRYPPCVGLARDTVEKKAEFFVKKMKWRLKELVSNSQVFGYSMEKRIVPRCNVIEALLSRGLLGSNVPALSSVLVCTDQSFLKKYVKKHDDDKQLVLVLMDVFQQRETRT